MMELDSPYRSFYRELGVSPDANLLEIQRAYRSWLVAHSAKTHADANDAVKVEKTIKVIEQFAEIRKMTDAQRRAIHSSGLNEVHAGIKSSTTPGITSSINRDEFFSLLAQGKIAIRDIAPMYGFSSSSIKTSSCGTPSILDSVTGLSYDDIEGIYKHFEMSPRKMIGDEPNQLDLETPVYKILNVYIHRVIVTASIGNITPHKIIPERVVEYAAMFKGARSEDVDRILYLGLKNARLDSTTFDLLSDFFSVEPPDDRSISSAESADKRPIPPDLSGMLFLGTSPLPFDAYRRHANRFHLPLSKRPFETRKIEKSSLNEESFLGAISESADLLQSLDPAGFLVAAYEVLLESHFKNTDRDKAFKLQAETEKLLNGSAIPEPVKGLFRSAYRKYF